MPKLICTLGLPASGKSTWAIEQIKTYDKYKRVNKDDLRNMIDAGKWSRTSEKHILSIHDQIILDYLSSGYDVICDNTNFAHIDRYKELARINKFEFEVKFFDTPLEECIQRDAKRDKPVGKKVILQMWNQYLKPKAPEYNPELPDCLIVDIDGTLSLNNGRNPFDETKVLDDLPNMPVVEVIKHFYSSSLKRIDVIIFSGRTEGCKTDTKKWLIKNLNIPHQLYMRKVGDTRSDDIIKRELYEEHIKDKYNVKAVFDDRIRVCRLWYSLGLFVFNCNQGLIEF